MSQIERPKWSGNLGFILAAAGSAVGLGNIWKFPYITGENGGGAFVLVYLICVALVGMPVLMAELFIGKKGRANAIKSYENLHKKGSPWRFAGALGLVGAFVILSFYSVIGGWILGFKWHALLGDFSGRSEPEIKNLLASLFANPARQIFLHALFTLLTIGIVVGGVQNGIEKWSRILMPALVALLLALFVYSFFLPGFEQALIFLFYPDFSKLTWNSVLEAVGHSFFTLSVGVGVMVTFGSYMAPKDNLVKMSFCVTAIDTLIALCAGTIIFSAVFTFGIDFATGPTLIFESLPVLFSKMPGGYLLAVAFFLLIAFTALTSSISILEVVVSYCVETFNVQRKRTTVAVGFLAFLLGLLSDLSTNILKDFHVFGYNFFDFFDKATSSVMLPISGLLTAIFVGWSLGPKAIDGIFEHIHAPTYKKVVMFSLRFLVPIAILAILSLGFD